MYCPTLICSLKKRNLNASKKWFTEELYKGTLTAQNKAFRTILPGYSWVRSEKVQEAPHIQFTRDLQYACTVYRIANKRTR